MWALIKGLILKWAFFKALLKSFRSLAFLLPIAFLLKFIGLPILAVLGIIAAPVLFFLAIIGLPFLLVFVIGGILVAMVFMALSVGLVVLKIALPIILIVWLIRWVFGRNGNGGGTNPDEIQPKPAE